jgi:preprotein translocase subunit SecA
MAAAEIGDQVESQAEALYDQRARANGQQIFRQLVDEDVTLEGLAQRADPFSVTLSGCIMQRLNAPPAEDVAALPLRQLPPEVQQAVQEGVVDGSALYRDRLVMLRAVDERWVRHLTDLDSLREGIGLRAYGQVQPLVAYKKEAFEMYEELRDAIENDIVHAIFKVDVVRQQQPARRVAQTNRGAESAEQPPQRRTGQILGRNDPCWCGSGKKYKHCHMRSDQGSGGPPPPAQKAPAGQSAGAKSQPPASTAKRRRPQR